MCLPSVLTLISPLTAKMKEDTVLSAHYPQGLVSPCLLRWVLEYTCVGGRVGVRACICASARYACLCDRRDACTSRVSNGNLTPNKMTDSSLSNHCFPSIERMHGQGIRPHVPQHTSLICIRGFLVCADCLYIKFDRIKWNFNDPLGEIRLLQRWK